MKTETLKAGSMPGSGPSGGRVLANALDRELRHPGQNRGQVLPEGHLEPAAAFDDGKNGGHFRPCLLAADMDPVLPFMYTCA